jgi:hypothetical protein
MPILLIIFSEAAEICIYKVATPSIPITSFVIADSRFAMLSRASELMKPTVLTPS